MAKSGVSLNWNGFDRAVNGLASRSASAKTALMAEIGEALVSGTIKRFADGEDPEGNPWEASWRAQNEGGKTLTDTADLRNSIDYVAAPDSVMVGSNKEYARIHQLGGIITPKNGKFLKFKVGGKDVFARKVTIPARPYLGVSKADAEEVQGILAEFLAQPFKAGK